MTPYKIVNYALLKGLGLLTETRETIFTYVNSRVPNSCSDLWSKVFAKTFDSMESKHLLIRFHR